MYSNIIKLDLSGAIEDWESRNAIKWEPNHDTYRRMKIGAQTFHAFLRGTKTPTIDEVNRIAAFLDCPASRLIEIVEVA